MDFQATAAKNTALGSINFSYIFYIHGLLTSYDILHKSYEQNNVISHTTFAVVLTHVMKLYYKTIIIELFYKGLNIPQYF